MRKLASIQQIAEVAPIEGADAIERVRVQDWWCVSKRGEFKAGDLCVYFEIDSLLPMTEQFAFLANRGTRKSELEDGTIVEGYRLKTIKLRGQLSQGLALPISSFGEALRKTETNPDKLVWAKLPRPESPGVIKHTVVGVGDDVTSILGVHKYEKPMNAQLRGLARGNFPSFLRRSDQERCQNLRPEIWDAYEANDKFQVTVKLDGSSMTAFYVTDQGTERFGTEARFGVCSRNLELKESEDNAFWKMARQIDLEEKLKKFCEVEKVDCIAVQGELLAPNIQGNFEGVDRLRFFVYNMFDGDSGQFISPVTSKNICDSQLGLDYVPLVKWDTGMVTLRELFPNATQDTIVQELLDYADGPSALGGAYREGIVLKRTDGQFSFKVISNRYLVHEK